MKKSFIFCLCMVAVVMFTACNKESDGVYKPAKKIHKIYSVENGQKELLEVWNWSGDLLNSIDEYYNGQVESTTRFDYLDDLLISMTIGRTSAYFNYSGKHVTYIQVTYLTPSMESIPVADYYFEYGLLGTKLSQIKMVLYEDAMDYKSVDSKSILTPLKYVLPQSCVEVQNIAEKHLREAKGIGTVTLTMNMTWTGKNVTSVETTEEMSILESPITVLTQCTFDKQKNPIKYFLGSLLGSSDVDNLYCNENNMLTSSSSMEGTVYNSTKSEYEYEDKYPVKVTTTTTDGEGTVFVDSYIYEY